MGRGRKMRKFRKRLTALSLAAVVALDPLCALAAEEPQETIPVGFEESIGETEAAEKEEPEKEAEPKETAPEEGLPAKGSEDLPSPGQTASEEQTRERGETETVRTEGREETESARTEEQEKAEAVPTEEQEETGSVRTEGREETETIRTDESVPESGDGRQPEQETVQAETQIETYGSVLIPAGRTGAEVTLYALDEWAQNYIRIPAGYAQSVPITIAGYDAGKIEWHSENGEIAYVGTRGVIWPGRTTRHYLDGTSEEEYTFDEPVLIYGYAGGQKFEIKVTVRDYSEVYADQVMDQYINANISAGMSDHEKVERICQFVAGYAYSVDFSSATGMIVGGEGFEPGDRLQRAQRKLWLCGRSGDPGDSSECKKAFDRSGRYGGTVPWNPGGVE